MMKIIVILTLLLLSGIMSCDDNNPLIQPTKFTIDKFPHEIGTVWQYQRENRLRMLTDTLFVRIADTATITDDSLLVYIVISDVMTAFTNSSDTSYWYISGDTVTFYNFESELYKVANNIVFPLAEGSVWSTGVFPPDSSEVTQISQKTILENSYQNAHLINRVGGALNEYINESYWCVPNIGFIQMNYNHTLWTSIKDETWNLISFYKPDSFELSDFPLQINATWTYKVYNNLLDCVNCFDTCTVTILDSNYKSLSFIGENWLFDYPNQEKVIENTLYQNKLFLQWHHYPVYFSLEFPLTVGKQWTDGSLFYSTVQVLGQQTVTTEAGTFKDAYCLKGQTGGFEESSTFYIWIAKNYGIIKLLHSGFVTGSYEDKSWELKSYAPHDTSHIFTIDKFPNYDGMTRTYEVFDYNRQVYDTIYTQVAESSTVALWNYTNSDSSWQEIISIEGTVAKLFYPDNMIEPFKSYRFPIEIGKSWVTYPLGNSSEVLFATPLTLPAGRFFPCYGIQTTYNCGNGCIHRETDWVCPQIGIVQKNIYIPHLSINENWRLIDYSNP